MSRNRYGKSDDFAGRFDKNVPETQKIIFLCAALDSKPSSSPPTLLDRTHRSAHFRIAELPLSFCFLTNMPIGKKRKTTHETARDPDLEADLEPLGNGSDGRSRSPSPSQASIAGVDAESERKTFKDLGIIDSLCEACDSLGYKTATPIQSRAIPLALEGRDLIGLAETGSGKTAAFALPILQGILNDYSWIGGGLVLTECHSVDGQATVILRSMSSTDPRTCFPDL